VSSIRHSYELLLNQKSVHADANITWAQCLQPDLIGKALPQLALLYLAPLQSDLVLLAPPLENKDATD